MIMNSNRPDIKVSAEDKNRIREAIRQALGSYTLIAERLNTMETVWKDGKTSKNITREDVIGILAGDIRYSYSNSYKDWQDVFKASINKAILSNLIQHSNRGTAVDADNEADVKASTQRIEYNTELQNFAKKEYDRIFHNEKNVLKPPSLKELSLTELESRLKRARGILKSNKEPTQLTENEDIKKQIKILENRINIIKLRDIADSAFWDDKGAGLIGGSRKTPDTINKCRSILNDPDTNDVTKINKLKILIKEKLKAGQKEWNNDSDNANTIWAFKLLVGACVRLSSDKKYKPYYMKFDQNIMPSFLNRINTNYEKDKSSLDTLKELVDDETLWLDKGTKNNKGQGENRNDFTPHCILEYRKILSDNTMTQENKIKAIKKISQSGIHRETHYMRNFRVHVNNMLEHHDDSSQYLEVLNADRKTAEAARNAAIKSVHEAIQKKLMETKWNKLGTGYLGDKLPDGIREMRDVFNDNGLSRWEQLEAVFAISEVKLTEHRSRGMSIFSRPTHHDVTDLYSAIRRISNTWHSLKPEELKHADYYLNERDDNLKKTTFSPR